MLFFCTSEIFQRGVNSFYLEWFLRIRSLVHEISIFPGLLDLILGHKFLAYFLWITSVNVKITTKMKWFSQREAHRLNLILYYRSRGPVTIDILIRDTNNWILNNSFALQARIRANSQAKALGHSINTCNLVSEHEHIKMLSKLKSTFSSKKINKKKHYK